MKAVFLDRDGTVICEPPDERVDKIEKIELFPDTIEALKLLSSLEYGVFFITNQTGIAEGRISKADFDEINGELIKMLQPSGIIILKTYMCPHRPEDNCICRKPKPTMLEWAAKDFDIDLTNSWMIGDRETDVMAGINAGTKTILLKNTGTSVNSDAATYNASNLLDAIRYITKK